MSAALHEPGEVWCFYRDGTYEIGDRSLSSFRIFGDTMALTDVHGVTRIYAWVIEEGETSSELRFNTVHGSSAYRFVRSVVTGTRLPDQSDTASTH